MAVDKAKLTSYIDELGFPDAVRTAMLAELEKNEDAANKFVGQRLRHDDYTRKAQELGATKKTLEEQVTQQLTGYATELANANAQIEKIAKDLESEQISRSTAEARLQKVKTTYALSDEEIPTVTEIVNKVPTASSPALDIKAMMEEFKTTIIKEIRTDLSSMPQVTASQMDISEQHRELFGKRMTRDEMTEITDLAQKNRTNLQTAWENKHGVQEVRTTKRVETEIAKARQTWTDEQQARNDAAALSSVTSQRETGIVGKPQSSVLGRQFETHEDVGSTPRTDPAGTARADKSVNPVQKLSGAERAAVAWQTKANAGMIGKTMPVGK